MKTISNQRAKKIARNINAMDLHYQYCDDMKAVRFWDNLKDKLKDILNTLSENDKKTISLLCKQDNAQYFGLNF